MTITIRDLGGSSAAGASGPGAIVAGPTGLSGIQMRALPKLLNLFRVGGAVQHVNPTTITTQLLIDNVNVAIWP